MEKLELTEGLRHAIERGYSLNVAISSFINAGYNQQDVLDSAKSLGSSLTSPEIKPVRQIIQQPAINRTLIQPQPQRTMQPQIMSSRVQQPSQSTVFNTGQAQPKKVPTAVIILSAILIILIGALTAVILARDSIAGMFS